MARPTANFRRLDVCPRTLEFVFIWPDLIEERDNRT